MSSNNEKIEAVIVAAGLSRRVGKWKPALPFGGKTVIESAISPFLAVCDRIIVVGGYKFDQLRSILGKYERVKLVYNPNFEGEMFVSVKVGVAQVRSDRFFFTPGDYPLISVATLERMLEVKSKIVIPTYRGRKGHPVLINSELVPKLMREPDDSSLKKFLARHPAEIIEVDDEGIRLDIDTWDDYLKLLERLKSRG